MPKAPKTNRTTSSPSNHPYASASAHRTTAMDVSHLTPAPATERSSASPWTEGDDRTLMEARQTPLSWAQIAGQHFPSKTPNACRKRYERLMEKRKNHDNWDVEAMAQAYMEVREPMWQMLASRLSQTWQAVEGKVFLSLSDLVIPFSSSPRRPLAPVPTFPLRFASTDCAIRSMAQKTRDKFHHERVRKRTRSCVFIRHACAWSWRSSNGDGIDRHGRLIG